MNIYEVTAKNVNSVAVIQKNSLPRRIDKPWGYELLYALTDRYAGKILFIKKGNRFSLQYHKEKDESMHLFNGRAIMEIESETGQMENRELNPGDSIRVPPKTKHRIEALEDTTILEVSTPELTDVVRIDDDYGRKGRVQATAAAKHRS